MLLPFTLVTSETNPTRRRDSTRLCAAGAFAVVCRRHHNDQMFAGNSPPGKAKERGVFARPLWRAYAVLNLLLAQRGGPCTCRRVRLQPPATKHSRACSDAGPLFCWVGVGMV